VTLLRRVLKVQAGLWVFAGVALGLIPTRVISALGQFPVLEVAWLRMLGVTSVVLALFMFLVAQRLSDVWWWAWAFALLELGIGALALLNVIVGEYAGDAWAWWAIGGVSLAFAAAVLIGLALAGREKPFT
jgi:peptidoglycan/LPS O-acetylase OafA/YrhL